MPHPPARGVRALRVPREAVRCTPLAFAYDKRVRVCVREWDRVCVRDCDSRVGVCVSQLNVKRDVV